jgi:hypothetical protein
MERFAFPTPVLPGKQAGMVAGLLRPRMAEYEESRRQKGITVERAYEMATPMGNFVIAYIEAERGFAEVHGMDMSQPPPPSPEPEVVGHWRDPDVRDRRRGLAFVAPLIPGRTDAARAFAHQAWVERVAEHTASRRAVGITQETAVLNSTPDGDVICVYLEGDDPAEGNRRHAASRSPYDTWFKDQLRTLFPPQVDFDQPLPPITTLWDWHRSPVTA